MSAKARPTTYRGIRMRSRLEADFAAWLDAREIHWTYEPMCFANETGQYLPDFCVALREGFQVYIEVKPEIIWDSEPNSHLMLVPWRYGKENLSRYLVAWAGDRVWGAMDEGQWYFPTGP